MAPFVRQQSTRLLLFDNKANASCHLITTHTHTHLALRPVKCSCRRQAPSHLITKNTRLLSFGNKTHAFFRFITEHTPPFISQQETRLLSFDNKAHASLRLKTTQNTHTYYTHMRTNTANAHASFHSTTEDTPSFIRKQSTRLLAFQISQTHTRTTHTPGSLPGKTPASTPKNRSRSPPRIPPPRPPPARSAWTATSS